MYYYDLSALKEMVENKTFENIKSFTANPIEYELYQCCNNLPEDFTEILFLKGMADFKEVRKPISLVQVWLRSKINKLDELEAKNNSVISNFTSSIGSASLGGGTTSSSKTADEETEANKSTLAGDVNGDGKVDNADMLRLLEYLSGEKVDINSSTADVNKDGVIDKKDLLSLVESLTGTPSATETTSLIGDINGDKNLTNEDLQVLISYIKGNKLEKNEEVTDINYDGVTDIQDLIDLTQIITGATISTDEIAIETVDVNGDGKFDKEDLTALAKYLVGETSSVYSEKVDINKDQKINEEDLQALTQYLMAATVSTEGTEQKLIGDVNGDGVINDEDAKRLYEYINKKDVTVEEALSDINSDGKIDIYDLINLVQIYNVGGEITMTGDVNGDLTVDMEDVKQIIQYINGKEISIDASKLDINGDGKVDVKDSLELMKHITGATMTSDTTSCSSIGQIIYKEEEVIKEERVNE